MGQVLKVVAIFGIKVTNGTPPLPGKGMIGLKLKIWAEKFQFHVRQTLQHLDKCSAMIKEMFESIGKWLIKWPTERVIGCKI